MAKSGRSYSPMRVYIRRNPRREPQRSYLHLLSFGAIGQFRHCWFRCGTRYMAVARVRGQRSAARRSLSSFPAAQTTRFIHLTKEDIPLAQSYTLLAFLLCLIPLATVAFRTRSFTFISKNLSVKQAARIAYSVQAAAQFVLVYSWAQATPFLIRPLWSWSLATPDIEAIQPLQSHAQLLAAVSASAVLARAVVALGVDGAAPRRSTGSPSGSNLKRHEPLVKRFPIWLRSLAKGAIYTVLFSGLVAHPWQGLLLGLMLSLLFYGRHVLSNRIPGWYQSIQRTPLVLRLGASATLSYLLTHWVVLPRAQSGATSFDSVLITLLISFAFAGALMPEVPQKNIPGQG